MRLTIRLGLSCLLVSLAASAQLTTPVVDTSGVVKYLEVKIATPFAAGVTGATVDVFASCAAGPPVVGVGPSLLKPGNASQYTTTKAGTLMPLLLASPLHAKDPICVLETFTGPAPVPPQTFPATVQPMPAPAPPALAVPVIEAITYPTEPFLNIDPVKPLAGVTANLDVFASCTDGPPAAGVLPSLLAPGQDTTVDPNASYRTLLLKAAPAANSTLCALETFIGGPAPVPVPVHSVSVTVPSAPQPTLTVRDINTLSLVDQASAGTTVSLYKLSTPYACSSAAPATSLALAPAASSTLTTPPNLDLALAAPLGSTPVVFCAVDSLKNTTPAYVYLPPVQPVFRKTPLENGTSIQVHATPSDSASGAGAGYTTNVQLLQLTSVGDPCNLAHGVPIALAGSTSTSLPTDASGNVTFTLAAGLTSGATVCALQTITLGNGVKQLPPADPTSPMASVPVVATTPTDWGLVRAYFTGGVILSNDSSNFSSASEFLDLNVDKTWRLPVCSFCEVTPSTAAYTVIDVLSTEKYQIWGTHIHVRGAKPSGNSLAPIDASVGLVISGNYLKLVEKVPGGATSIKKIDGAIIITGGTVSYDPAKQVEISANSVTLLGSNSLELDGPATVAFRGSTLGNSIGHNFSSPGINTIFDARITAIPVAINPTSASATGNGGTPTASTTTFLNTQKTARIAVGAYFPVLLTHWTWQSSTNALFIAPMAKIGFDTITGSTQQNVILPGGGSGTENYQQVYKFWNYGARIGHMQMAKNANQAPETYSYLDIGIGPYSNLESLNCGRTEYTLGSAAGVTPVVAPAPLPGQHTATTYTTNTNLPNGDCAIAYPALYQNSATPVTFQYLPYETLKRIYRLDIEGLLKIPSTPLYVGFNANIGQKALGAGNFDPAFNAPDDLRFFFGTKFDISAVLTKLLANVGN